MTTRGSSTLAVESRARWRAWEERFGVELSRRSGRCSSARPSSGGFALLRAAGVRARMVDARRGAPDRAPGPAMLDEDGGVIRTTTAIARASRRSATRSSPTRWSRCCRRGRGPRRRRDHALRPRDRLRRPRHRDPRRARRRRDPGSRLDPHAVRLSGPRAGRARLPPGHVERRLRRPAARRRRATRSGSTAPRPPTRTSPQRCPGSTRGPSRRARAGSPSCRAATTRSRSGRPARCTFVAGNNLFKHAPALGWRLAAGAVDDLRPEARLGTNVNAAG